MKAHVRNYFKHFDIGMEDVVYCENCGKAGRVDRCKTNHELQATIIKRDLSG